MVESMEGLIPRTSLLDPCVRFSPHTASDNLTLSAFANMDEIVAGLVYSQQIVGFPVVVVSINVVEVYSFFVNEF